MLTSSVGIHLQWIWLDKHDNCQRLIIISLIFGICSWYFFILKSFTILIFLNICPGQPYKTKTIQKARNERFKFVKWYCSKFKLRYWEIPVKDYRPGWRFTLIKTIGSRKITTYIPVHECLYKTSLPPAKKKKLNFKAVKIEFQSKQTKRKRERCSYEMRDMMRRNPSATSAYELRPLSVLLFLCTHIHGTSKYLLYNKKSRTNNIINLLW